MKGQKGAALVEAAVTLPFVILLVLGTIDLARAYFDAAKVQEAAQEGAIYASFNPTPATEVVTRTTETITNLGFDSADITVTVSCDPLATDQVTVTVGYTFNLITPIISNIFGPDIDLTHAETAQILSAVPCEAAS